MAATPDDTLAAPFNHVLMLVRAKETFSELEGYDYAEDEFTESELEVIANASDNGIGIPGIDYGHLLFRYIDNFGNHEGTTYHKQMKFTPEEEAEFDRLQEVFGAPTKSVGP